MLQAPRNVNVSSSEQKCFFFSEREMRAFGFVHLNNLYNENKFFKIVGTLSVAFIDISFVISFFCTRLVKKSDMSLLSVSEFYQ